MTEERVVVGVREHVAHVELNRAEKKNGLDLPMFDALIAAGVALQSRADVRAVVLSGRGGTFSAGLDFAAFMADAERSVAHLMDERDGPANRAQRVAWVWRELAVPVVAAIEGACFGGGFQIAAGADIRIAAPDARLSVMEIKWGLIPDMGITQTLAPWMRQDVLRELTYTGRIVDAEQAQRLGMVTQVESDPVAAALALARTIAGKSPTAIRAAKALFCAEEAAAAPRTFTRESDLQRPLLGSANQMEAVMANLQKRAPAFTDAEPEPS